jgi:hypothetical protein
MKSGAILLTLDPAAAYANLLYRRDDFASPRAPGNPNGSPRWQCGRQWQTVADDPVG